jgi:membrane-bound lytic murein transglycosylase D
MIPTAHSGLRLPCGAGGGFGRPRLYRFSAGLVLIGLLSGFTVLSAASPRDPFSENGLSAQVDFWEQVFTRYGRNQVLIHDRLDLRLVYTILELDGDSLHDPAAAKAQERAIRAEFDHWKGLLHHAARNVKSGDAPDRSTLRVLSIVGGQLGRQPPADELREMADRLRAQRGIREEFMAGWRRSGRYYPHMVEIFRIYGIPQEILAIPFFESSFREDSKSRKGATGVWQFIRSTGRVFLRVNRNFDERLDPLLATQGAANFLLDAYARLGSWPLAVMAYNHGTNGIMRAQRQLGSDPPTIIRYYSSGHFGFASRNYYPEFLASRRILKQPDRHFPGLEPEPAWQFREIRLPRSRTLADLQKEHQVPSGVILDYNPAVIRSRANAKLAFPAGFRLKLPPAETTRAATAVPPEPARPLSAPAAPAPAPPAPASPTRAVHRVKAGETLYRIARTYKVTVVQLREWNQLPDNTIRVGQRLIVQP